MEVEVWALGLVHVVVRLDPFHGRTLLPLSEEELASHLMEGLLTVKNEKQTLMLSESWVRSWLAENQGLRKDLQSENVRKQTGTE